MSKTRLPKELIEGLQAALKPDGVGLAAYRQTLNPGEDAFVAKVTAQAQAKKDAQGSIATPALSAPAPEVSHSPLKEAQAKKLARTAAAATPDTIDAADAPSSAENVLTSISDVVNVANQMMKDGKLKGALEFAKKASNDPTLKDQDRIEIDAWLIRNNDTKMLLSINPFTQESGKKIFVDGNGNIITSKKTILIHNFFIPSADGTTFAFKDSAASASASSTEYKGLSEDGKTLTLPIGIFTFHNPIVTLPRGDGIYDVLDNPKVWKIVPASCQVRVIGDHEIMPGNHEVEIPDYIAGSCNISIPSGYTVKKDDHKTAIYEDCEKLVAQYSAQSSKLLPHKPGVNPALDDIADQLLDNITKLNALNRESNKAAVSSQHDTIVHEVNCILFGKPADNPDSILRVCNNRIQEPFSKLSLNIILYGINKLKELGVGYQEYLDFKTWALNHGADIPFKLDQVYKGQDPNAVNIIIDSHGNPISTQLQHMLNFFSLSEDGKAFIRDKPGHLSSPATYLREETKNYEKSFSLVDIKTHTVLAKLMSLSFDMQPDIMHTHTNTDLQKMVGYTCPRDNSSKRDGLQISANAKIIGANGPHCNIYKLSFTDGILYDANTLDVSEKGVYVKNPHVPKSEDFVAQSNVIPRVNLGFYYAQGQDVSAVDPYHQMMAYLVSIFPQKKDWFLEITAKHDFLDMRHKNVLNKLELSENVMNTLNFLMMVDMNKSELKIVSTNIEGALTGFQYMIATPIEQAVESVLEAERVDIAALGYNQDDIITPHRKALDPHGKEIQDEIVRAFIADQDITNAAVAIRDHGGSIALAVYEAVEQNRANLPFVQQLLKLGVNPLTNLDAVDPRIKDAVLEALALSPLSTSAAAAATKDETEDHVSSDPDPVADLESKEDFEYSPGGDAHQHDL